MAGTELPGFQSAVAWKENRSMAEGSPYLYKLLYSFLLLLHSYAIVSSFDQISYGAIPFPTTPV